MKRYAVLLAALLAICAPSASHGQGAVKQSGNVTPGHAAGWTTNGVIQDGGVATNGSLTSLGVTAQGPGICQNSGPITGPYNEICLNASATSGGFTFTNNGGATGSPQICINGTCTQLGLIGGIITTVRSSSAATVTASPTSDYFFCLDPTNNAIALNLNPTPVIGQTFLIKDCTGQSNVHAITITPASGNIDGAANFQILVPYQSIAVTYTGAQWSIN